MTLRQITVLIPSGSAETLDDLKGEPSILDMWVGVKRRGGPTEINILAMSENLQLLIDKLQVKATKDKDLRIIISPVETTIPRNVDKPEDAEKQNATKSYGGLTREALYDQIFKNVQATQDFILLVILSTIVTAIGLITDNLAVIIGAMVIAPLLGPNLALSFGVTLGDKDMISEALKANAIGFGVTLGLSIILGALVSHDGLFASHEYMSRTQVGYDAIILALASGAAAVLSLTAGISSAMVGVMVAVALMPPAVTLGLSVGAGAVGYAYGAFLLLSINIICVNIAAKAVFTLKGIRPRTWYMRNKTKQSLKLSLVFWGALLVVLMGLIYLWQQN